MSKLTDHELRDVVARFAIPGDLISALPFGTGHINDTFQLTFDQAGTLVRYTLQRHLTPKQF